MKVIIIGGGIGGLTVAHQLIKYGIKCEIYEKNNEIGGLARSNRDINGCATEYCWRVFFGFYHNLFRTMSEIPLIENNTKNILTNFTIYKHENIIDNPTRLWDKFILFLAVLYGFTSCDKRMDKLDNLTWWNALGSTKKSNLFREIGGWLGMDRYRGSYNSVIRVGMEMQILQTYLDSQYRDYITTKPTSEALFNHWKHYLENNGVKFKLNHELESIEIDNNSVKTAYIRNGMYLKEIHGDYFIFAIPIEVLSRIILQTPQLQYVDLLKSVELSKTCLHIQLSFQVYFNKPIHLGTDKNAFLLVESPWDLIVLSYDRSYENTQLCKHISGAKGGWSIAVCTAYINGIVYGKPMNKCSYNEIITEIWAQLKRSKILKEIIRKNNNFELSEELIVLWSPMWENYKYINGKLITDEPKFTNNVGSLIRRPSYKTRIHNLYISTGYIKETIDIFSMEAACIAGKRVVADILKKSEIEPIEISRPKIFYIFRVIDSIMYKLNLPNINILLIITIILVILYLFIPQKKK